LILALYRAAGTVAFPFLKKKLRARHEVGFDERCGLYDTDKIEHIRAAGGGENLWIHAVSVGEVQAASPIVRAARDGGYGGAITLSTVTETGARNAERLMGDWVTARVYAPWDVPRVVRRACDALRPSAYVTVETEVWPALLSELRERGVPRILANARVSDRAWGRRGSLASFFRAGYGLFDLILARGEEDERRLLAFGADESRIVRTGDAKIDAIIRRRREASDDLPAIRKKISLAPDERCFVAGSTHEGEDEIVLAAFAKLKEWGMEGARLIVAPRHPERADDVAALASGVGSAARYSALGEGAAPEIVVVDVIGVLYAMYGLASSAFIGGSLVPKGGQNLLEPASWCIPVLHGPHMEDFAAPTAELDRNGDAFTVRNADEIADIWGALFRDSRGGIERPKKLPAYFEKNAGAATLAWERIEHVMAAADRNLV
jgi:3-deoxy-D-manno-octulosonic-acid transferase